MKLYLSAIGVCIVLLAAVNAFSVTISFRNP